MEENVKVVIGCNLRLLREAAGHSQEKFAELLKISRQTLSSIETGKVAPDSTKLLAASQILGCPLTDFFREEEEKVALLFRAAEHTIPNAEVRSRFQRLSRAYRELEEIVGVAETSISPPEYSFYPEAHSKHEAFATLVAKSERDRLGLGPCEPIENIFDLLEQNGVRIVFDEVAQRDVFGVSGYSRKTGTCILLSLHSTLERKIITVAHELAHLLMHRYLYQPRENITIEQDSEIESMANVFAAAFLVPELGLREMFAKNIGGRHIDIEDVVFLKQHFRVSNEVIVRRIRKLKLASSEDCDKVWAKIRALEPDVRREYRPLNAEKLRDWCSTSRFCHLQRKAALGGMISISRLAELLGKNVVEARNLVKDWRSELELVPA